MPHSRSLLRVASRLAGNVSAAEDLVQETLLRAWRHFSQFQKGTNVRAWLFRILFNAFYEQGRKLRSGPVLVPLPEPDSRAEPSRNAKFSALDAAEVGQAFGELSTEHRTVLLLAIVEGFTCREMAEILSVPIGTVMSRLSRARRELRIRLAPAASDLSPARSEVECAEREAS